MDTVVGLPAVERAPEELASLWESIGRIRVGMLTTIGTDGALASRPMMTQEIDPTGILWFFAAEDGALAQSIASDTRVSLGYADLNDGWFASLCGSAQLVHDSAKTKALWHPAFSAWFPGGFVDSELALLRVTVYHAEYWINCGKMAQLFAVAKAALLQTPLHDIGEHHVFDI